MRAWIDERIDRLWQWWRSRRTRELLGEILEETAQLDMRIVGRTLLQAALVGLAAGIVGAIFFASLEFVQRILLEGVAGYTPLRAHGEEVHAAAPSTAREIVPWLIVAIPAVGGLLCGLITRLAPEARGGGGDAMIDAFHHNDGSIRPRVIVVKALASLATLGSGGAGGREGPTMQIGGALGSLVGRVLDVSPRERRILLVAGVAAGISAVFRTPLGAAILAVEILYRDGFESDALVPSVLSSVVSYSVVISIFGESTLFAHAPRYPFVPAHLPLYGALAIIVAGGGALFVLGIRRSRATFDALKVPGWLRPAIGGLALGALALVMLLVAAPMLGTPPEALGIFGGGYGAAQAAITGAPWLKGWTAVQLLLLLAVMKLIAATLTIGSGGSAGDFAPSLAIGGLLGGAFGRAAQLITGDTRIDAGAFALVGMGAFYGGIARVPLAALVLVCEMAGNYDLLVPLMLALGIAYIALRHRTLYPAQVASPRESPAHRQALLLAVLDGQVAEHMVKEAPKPPEPEPQPALPDDQTQPNNELPQPAPLPPLTVKPGDNLASAARLMVMNSVTSLPVVDENGNVIGRLDEKDVARVYLKGIKK